MGTENRQQNSFIEKLQTNPERFEFFQAVHLLLQAIKEINNNKLSSPQKDTKDNKILPFAGIRFKTVTSLSFPKSSIERVILMPDTANQVYKNYFFEAHINFFGLTGVNGILPDHYTELLMGQIHNHNYGLQDFFDIFNHRSTTLFYKAWEKYHFPFNITDSLPHKKKRKKFSYFIESIYGNGTPSLRDRLRVPEKILSYYSGFLARKIRSAHDLESMLTDYFSVPIKVKQFQKEYIYVSDQDLTCLGNREKGRYNQLGLDTILGKKLTSVLNSFRVFICSLSFNQFQSFLPPNSAFSRLYDLVKFYAGPQYTFNLQLELNKEEVPFCELSSKSPIKLGWETWIGAAIPAINPSDTIINTSQNTACSP